MVQQFNAAFYHGSSYTYDIGVQTTFVMPLYLGIVPEGDQANITIRLLNDIVSEQGYHLTTGILGTKYLMVALTMLGRTGIRN